MNKILITLVNLVVIFIFISFGSNKTYGEEDESILTQLETLQTDIKTLEKAVYSQNATNNFSEELSNDGNDVFDKTFT